MDIDKSYKNRNLELRRRQLLAQRQAFEVLRRRKQRPRDGRAQILAAFDGGADLGPLSAQIRRNLGTRKRPLSDEARDAMRRLLLRVHDETYLVNATGEMAYAQTVLRLARRHQQWVRQPEQWVSRSHNAARQLASLSRHLFARYPVPAFMDAAWAIYDDEQARLHQDWFIHVGRGENIRKAAGLPVPLTKLMAHHFLLAPRECSIAQAVRWGQLRGMGVGERLAEAVLGSRVGETFAGAEREAFWATMFNWLALNPMIDPHQVGPIIDFLHNQKFVPVGYVNLGGQFVEQGPPQPGLSMKGRTPEALVAQVESWHRQLNRVRRASPGSPTARWMSCGIGGYDRIEGEPGNQRRFFIVELLSAAELRAEGAAMKHCVATYAWSCQSGRTAIYSLQLETSSAPPQRRATIEVDLRHRQITQVRGKHNAPSTPLDQRILNAWSTTARLSFSRFAVARA